MGTVVFLFLSERAEVLYGVVVFSIALMVRVAHARFLHYCRFVFLCAEFKNGFRLLCSTSIHSAVSLHEVR